MNLNSHSPSDLMVALEAELDQAQAKIDEIRQMPLKLSANFLCQLDARQRNIDEQRSNLAFAKEHLLFNQYLNH